MHELRQLSHDRFQFSNESNSHLGQYEGALVDVGDGAALNRMTAEGSDPVADTRVPDGKTEAVAPAGITGSGREPGENGRHRDIRVLFWFECERAIDGGGAMSLEPGGRV